MRIKRESRFEELVNLVRTRKAVRESVKQSAHPWSI